MKNAKELMIEYTAFSLREPKKAAEMFAEDGAFELPYLATFGLPAEYRGRDAIAGFFQSVLDIYPGFKFENTKVLIDTPDQVFAEFEACACFQRITAAHRTKGKRSLTLWRQCAPCERR
jgi:hypothetical protein